MHAGFQVVAGGVPECPPQVDALAVRANIQALEEASREFAQVECPLNHYFAPGLYAREIFIPAGTVVVGKIHRHSHINIISHGVATVVTEFGRQRMCAPFTFVSEPGTKRSLIAETDLIWTTVHSNPDELTDVDVLESQIIAPDYGALGIENTPAKALEVKQ